MLLDRVREGDEDALAALLEEFQYPIRRVARRFLGRALRPHLDSVDLMQVVHKTLLLALRNQKIELAEPEKVVALATTIVQRNVAHYWGHIKRKPETQLSAAVGSQDEPFDDDTPAKVCAFTDEVENLLKGLNPVDRRLLELRLNGYTTADAARELDVAPSRLRMRLGRLRKRFKQLGFNETSSFA